MVVMLWIVVFVVKDTFRTIPTVEAYGAGVCCSRQNLIAVKLLITFPNFVRWQCLITRNVAEPSSSNRWVSLLNEACPINELSRGSVLGLKFSQTSREQDVS
jgi:hypothetical protein